MYTAEQILTASRMGQLLKKQGKPYKGILTSDEAFQRSLRTGTLCLRSSMKRNIFFFTDDHIFGHPVLPDELVSSTCRFPSHVTPRRELPDGNIMTIDQFIMIYQRDDRQLTTIEELVELLNAPEKQDHPNINEQDDSACLTCDNATMGYCKARDRSVRPFNNCSDFDDQKLYVLRPNLLKTKGE